MARIGDPASSGAPVWPWGAPRNVRERLVDPSVFDRKKRRKSGDPKSPALASADLLDFIGPGHTSDELRLPMPPGYEDGSEDFRPFPDRELTAELCSQGSEEARGVLAQAVKSLALPPERQARVMAMLGREARMLAVLGHIQKEVDEIVDRMKAELKVTGRY